MEYKQIDKAEAMEAIEKDEIEKETLQNDEAVMELAMQAGHLLLENGAEIFRVEETMKCICQSFGVKSGSHFVLSNGIFSTAGDAREHVFAKVQHIPVSGTHLDKVAAVNQLSRDIGAGRCTVSEAMEELERIKAMPEKKKIYQILASGVGSAAFCCLFGGGAMDSLGAFIAGIILYIYILFVSGPYLSKIVSNVGGGALVTVVCNLLFIAGLGDHLNFMVIGSIMPLVPGVAFTNAIRDVADGDYISGSVRMLDALLIFFCIAIGVGMGIAVLNGIMGGVSL